MSAVSEVVGKASTYPKKVPTKTEILASLYGRHVGEVDLPVLSWGKASGLIGGIRRRP